MFGSLGLWGGKGQTKEANTGGCMVDSQNYSPAAVAVAEGELEATSEPGEVAVSHDPTTIGLSESDQDAHQRSPLRL